MNASLAPAPHVRTAGRVLFALCVMTAPAFWFVQLLLGYGTWSYGCFPGDHPVRSDVASGIHAVVIAFDAIAILAALGAGLLSVILWRSAVAAPAEPQEPRLRTRFMAIWGMLFSGWFLAAIVFSTISSVMAPTCG